MFRFTLATHDPHPGGEYTGDECGKGRDIHTLARDDDFRV